MSRCRGGYAATVLINGGGILAFRDPHGVRPLCLGSRPGRYDGGGGGGQSSDVLLGRGGNGGDGGGSGKMDLAVASESAALTGLGFSIRRDVGAGEAVFLDVRTGAVSSRDCAPALPYSRRDDGVTDEEGRRGVPFKPCLFEYVYMARPDSILDGVPVSGVLFLFFSLRDGGGGGLFLAYSRLGRRSCFFSCLILWLFIRRRLCRSRRRCCVCLAVAKTASPRSMPADIGSTLCRRCTQPGKRWG